MSKANRAMLTMTVAAPSKKMDIKPVLSLFSRLLSFGMILNGKAKTSISETRPRGQLMYKVVTSLHNAHDAVSLDQFSPILVPHQNRSVNIACKKAQTVNAVTKYKHLLKFGSDIGNSWL